MVRKRPRRRDDEVDAPRFRPERDFVVQLPAANRGGTPSRGRVEHVLTGRSTRFESLEALAELFGPVLPSEPIGRHREEE